MEFFDYTLALVIVYIYLYLLIIILDHNKKDEVFLRGSFEKDF